MQRKLATTITKTEAIEMRNTDGMKFSVAYSKKKESKDFPRKHYAIMIHDSKYCIRAMLTTGATELDAALAQKVCDLLNKIK